MPTNTNEVVNRTPTARCRCTNPEPGTVLEDQSGELIEILCVKCRGSIRQQEERAQEQQAHERFDGDPRKLAGYGALEDMRKRATYSQGGCISSIEGYTFTTSGKFDGDPKKLAGYVSFEDMLQQQPLNDAKSWYSQGGYISSIEGYTFTTSGKFDGDPKKLAGYVSFEDMWQDRFLSNTKE
jgi:hypothetical protein